MSIDDSDEEGIDAEVEFCAISIVNYDSGDEESKKYSSIYV